MISLTHVFWFFVFFFALVGAMRGWAKELLVSFSVILAIFILTVMFRYVDFFQNLLTTTGPGAAFWLRAIILMVMAFFGYQTPSIPRLAQKAVRERLQDVLLGIFLGALNGIMIVGSLWFYLDQADYPFEFVIAPDLSTPAGQAAKDLVNLMLPNWLGVPYIYFAVMIAFAFVMIVFV